MFGKHKVHAPPDTRKKILIVEDNTDLSRLLSDKFATENFNVILAYNGAQAVEAALSKKPDLILLDIIMPVMDGKKAFEKIRHDNRTEQIPIIFLTNLTMVDELKNLVKFFPPTSYIVKSDVKMEEIVAKVKETLQLAQ